MLYCSRQRSVRTCAKRPATRTTVHPIRLTLCIARIIGTACALAIVLAVAACRPADRAPSIGPNAPAAPVIIYCSADEAFARPLLVEFEKRTGQKVRPVFDSEAGKTTGLIERIRAERGRPVADVWWSSEIYGTLQLAAEEMLAPYSPSTAADIPAEFKAADGAWTAFGLRGRVLAYDPRRLKPADLPQRWLVVTDAKWKGRIALANPLFGTTRGHMAQLMAAWGEPTYSTYVSELAKLEPRIADGNAHAVRMLVQGQVDLAWTDTDDVRVAKARGDSVDCVVPTFGGGADATAAERTMWIPNSVALVRSGGNPDGARRLVDYLVSAEVERALAVSESGNLPVRPALRGELGMTAHKLGAIDYARGAALLAKSDAINRAALLR